MRIFKRLALAASMALVAGVVPAGAQPAGPWNMAESGILRIRKIDAQGRPFLSPGATVSVRRISDPAARPRFGFNDYGPSVGPDQAAAAIRLPAGSYEVGLQVPDGFSVVMTGCASCTAGPRQNALTQTQGDTQSPTVLRLAGGVADSLTFTFTRRARSEQAATDTSETLHCNIAGVPGPMPPTDVLTFRGSESWARVGLNRTIGDVLVELDLINPQAPESPLALIDSRSAGGAAWQISLGGTEATGDVTHYNQGAGNSARVWGYEAPLSATQDGFVQQNWLPLFSDDRRAAGAGPEAAIGTSPCYNTGVRLGEGQFSLLHQTVQAGSGGSITRLLYLYALRHRAASVWKRFQFDYGIYFSPENRDLRVYFPGRDHVVGPIYPYRDMSITPRDQVRNVVCNAGDCLVATRPISYAVLVWHVQGEDIAIAIHTERASDMFDGFLRFRPHVTCVGGATCGGVQWHSEVRDTELHPDQQHQFQAGEITHYQLDYDIGTPAQLARLGYKSE